MPKLKTDAMYMVGKAYASRVAPIFGVITVTVTSRDPLVDLDLDPYKIRSKGPRCLRVWQMSKCKLTM